MMPEDIAILQRKQDYEDQDIELDAKMEGLDMFMQWELGQNKTTAWLFPCQILIPKPRRCIIMQYTKSKYDSQSYKEMRTKEFNRLKAEYQNNKRNEVQIQNNKRKEAN